jgi:hypothetical protein
MRGRLLGADLLDHERLVHFVQDGGLHGVSPSSCRLRRC